MYFSDSLFCIASFKTSNALSTVSNLPLQDLRCCCHCGYFTLHRIFPSLSSSTGFYISHCGGNPCETIIYFDARAQSLIKDFRLVTWSAFTKWTLNAIWALDCEGTSPWGCNGVHCQHRKHISIQSLLLSGWAGNIQFCYIKLCITAAVSFSGRCHLLSMLMDASTSLFAESQSTGAEARKRKYSKMTAFSVAYCADENEVSDCDWPVFIFSPPLSAAGCLVKHGGEDG